MYYVRKLSKTSNLQKIQNNPSPSIVPADFIGQELRTKENTLSVWRCESPDEEGRKDAIKAALFASSELSATQFIIFDSDMLEAAGIKTCDTVGKTGYKNLEHLHTDLCELTYEKLGRLLDLYYRTSHLKDRIPKIEKEEFKKIALEAYNSNCLDESKMDDHLRNEINKLVKKSIV